MSNGVFTRTYEKMCEEKINLVLMNGTAYVWKAEGANLDWFKIRKLRITGNFVGTLASLPRQDQLTGLPLALLKEETTLMLEKNLAVLNSIPNILDPPDSSIQELSKSNREVLFTKQVEIFENKRKKEIESKIDVILEGKKAKRKLNLDQNSELDKDSVLQQEFQKIQPPKKSNLVIQICTDDPWLQQSDYKISTWEFPCTQIERLHYNVYKDLWQKGYYITPGGKFGGNFLVYPGDPVKFHAFFIVVCLEKNRKLKMQEIITYGRLGQSVRKTTVLAYLGENDEVTYQSLQWAGF